MASAPALASAQPTASARLAVAPGTNLLGLLAAIDDAPGVRVILDATHLPRPLQTRTILTVLRRRADRRGKRLHLVTPSQTLWRLARLAELDGVASTEAAAEALGAPRASRIPADAVPTVAIDQPVDVPPPVGPGAAVEPSGTLGILARDQLSLEPIPSVDLRASTVTHPPETPAPRLASLVAWLDVDPHARSVGGGGPRGPDGPDGPDDEAWEPAGAVRGERLPPPWSEARLRVVRVDRDTHALALHGVPTAVTDRPWGVPSGSEAPGRETVTSGRMGARAATSGRAAREQVRERLRERASRRSLNRERLDRLAGRPRVATRPAQATGAAFVTGASQAVRRRLDRVAGRAAAMTAPTAARQTGRAAWRLLAAAVATSWRALAGVRLSAAAWQGLGAAGAVVAIGGLFTWHVVPSASVEIVPVVEAWSAAVPVIADPGARKVDPATARIPGRWIVKEASETGQAPATGKRVIPDGRAGGDAVFVNRSERQVTVPKGTIVTGAGVRFATQSDVTVPATVSTGALRRIGVARVQVVAETGGPAGNIERNKLATIEGAFVEKVNVQNDQAMRGGTERTITFVSADDRRRLLEAVQRVALEKLSSQVRTLTVDPAREVVVPLGMTGTPVALPGSPGMAAIDATFTRGENDEAASVSATVKARYAVTVFEAAAAQQVAQSGVPALVARQRPGHAPVGDAPRPATPEVGSGDPATGQVQLRVRVEAGVAPVVTASTVRDALAGKPADEARMILGRMPGVASYRLDQWPGWAWKTDLPWLGWRIGVATVAAGTTK